MKLFYKGIEDIGDPGAMDHNKSSPGLHECTHKNRDFEDEDCGSPSNEYIQSRPDPEIAAEEGDSDSTQCAITKEGGNRTDGCQGSGENAAKEKLAINTKHENNERSSRVHPVKQQDGRLPSKVSTAKSKMHVNKDKSTQIVKGKCLSKAQRPITIGPSRSNFTVPKPFSLATDKRAYDSPQSKAKPCVAMSIQLDKQKEEAPTLHVEQHYGNDVVSVSSRKSSQAPKAKASVFTRATSFNFQSDERAKRRKEFYSKLQEQKNAMEEEINQMQLHAQKDMEKETRLLRRSLTFKASPMPDFYHEGPPAKVELKKMPLTRSKSPKFSQRTCHADGNGCHRSIYCEVDCSSNSSSPKPVDGNIMGHAAHSRRPMRQLPKKEHTEPKSPLSSANSVVSMDTCADDASMGQRKVESAVANESMGESMGDANMQVMYPSDCVEKEGECTIQFAKNERIGDSRAQSTTGYEGAKSMQDNGRTGRAHANINVLQGLVNTSSHKTRAESKLKPIADDNVRDVTGKVPKRSTQKQEHPTNKCGEY